LRFRIDLKIFLILILYYITKQIEIYAIIMAFAVIHEMGHLVAGLLLKMKPENIEITPFGLSIGFHLNVTDYNKKIGRANLLALKKIIVAMAGPLTNVAIIAISYKLKFDTYVMQSIVYSNALIILFNILPIYPLDGGRILKGILHIIFGSVKAKKYIADISIVATIMLTFVASIAILYYKNIAIFLIIAYLWVVVIREQLFLKNY